MFHQNLFYKQKTVKKPRGFGFLVEKVSCYVIELQGFRLEEIQARSHILIRLIVV